MKYDVIHASVKGVQNYGGINEDTKIVDRNRNIYIVADGVGGHKEPKTASYLASQQVYLELSYLYKNLRKGRLSGTDISDIMLEILQATNGLISSPTKLLDMAKILDKQDEDLSHYFNIPSRQILESFEHIESMNNMGTTIDAYIIWDNTAYLGHVGNGRVYKLGKDFRKLTEEHVEYGKNAILPEPDKTLVEMKLELISCIGTNGNNRMDTIEEPVGVGDILFMASDGLTHTVSEAEIERELYDFKSARKMLLGLSEKPEEMARAYSEKEVIDFKIAQKRLGGMDNTSFIGIRRLK